MGLFGRRGNSKNRLKEHLINSNTIDDISNSFVQIDSINFHDEINSLDIHFTTLISLFNIKELFNILLPGNNLEKFEFNNLTANLKLENKIMLKVSPHIYEHNLNHIENIKYIKTDIIIIYFADEITIDVKNILLRGLNNLIDSKRKIYLNNK